MNSTQLAWVFAWIFLAIGVLGVVPGLVVNGFLGGVFKVGMVLAGMYLLTGIFAGLAAWQEWQEVFFRVFGIIYAAIAIIGFTPGTTVLEIFSINLAGNFLHAGTALVALLVGYCVCGSCFGCAVQRKSSGA